jgi:hypothetical protein
LTIERKFQKNIGLAYIVVVTELVTTSVNVVDSRATVARAGSGVTVMKSPSSSQGMGVPRNSVAQ